jgi:crotonobetainyl-CoA:carnitine CoA-transferase CaiB-like acyl-CoA transferase
MAIGGDPDRAPLRLPGEQAYALGGIQGAIAALTAIHARNASGKGQLVSVSTFQSTVLANYREPLTWEWTGRVGTRTGNLLVRGKSGVRQIWPCRDGYVTWSMVDNPGMMRGIVGVMKDAGMAGVLTDINWDTTLVADVPRETLIEWEAYVEAFFLEHTKAELAQLSVQHGFGLSRIDELDEVLNSEQLRQRGMWRTVTDEARDLTLRVPGPLFVRSE